VLKLLVELFEEKAFSFISGEAVISVKHFSRCERELNWLAGEDCFVEWEQRFLSSRLTDLFMKWQYSKNSSSWERFDIADKKMRTLISAEIFKKI